MHEGSVWQGRFWEHEISHVRFESHSIIVYLMRHMVKFYHSIAYSSFLADVKFRIV